MTDVPASKPARAPHWMFAAGAVLTLAGVWRLVLAWLSPCLARDGVVFCWYARDLARLGAAHLQDPATHQHPLFPIAILAVRAALRAAGWDDSPQTWQLSGLMVAWVAGMMVVMLVGAVAYRLVRVLGAAFDPGWSAVLAMLLAALLPLGTRLSADVMSDMPHLSLYLLGFWALLGLPSWRSAIVAGLAAAAAFLTRPEGAALIPAAFATLIALRARLRWPQLAGRALAVIVAFLLLAVPYWAVTGKLSPKKSPLDLLKKPARAVQVDAPASAAHPPLIAELRQPAAARLERQDLPAVQWIPVVLLETFRAGRVVIPVLGLIALVHAWRLWRTPPLVAWQACFSLHFALLVILQAKYHYLNPRHALVLIVLLIPWGALTLLGLRDRLRGRGWGWAWAPLMIAALVPLAAYATRVPNGDQRYLRTTAERLRAQDPAIADKTLMSGSGPIRVAFYADCHWRPWYEDAQRSSEAFRRHVARWQPDYFALETGPGFERAGNVERAALLEAGGSDWRYEPVFRVSRTPEITLIVLALERP